MPRPPADPDRATVLYLRNLTVATRTTRHRRKPAYPYEVDTLADIARAPMSPAVVAAATALWDELRALRDRLEERAARGGEITHTEKGYSELLWHVAPLVTGPGVTAERAAEVALTPVSWRVASDHYVEALAPLLARDDIAGLDRERLWDEMGEGAGYIAHRWALGLRSWPVTVPPEWIGAVLRLDAHASMRVIAGHLSRIAPSVLARVLESPDVPVADASLLRAFLAQIPEATLAALPTRALAPLLLHPDRDIRTLALRHSGRRETPPAAPRSPTGLRR